MSANRQVYLLNVHVINFDFPIIDTGLTWLFDCGEGTQMQLQRASGIKIPRIKRVFLTHLHADHVRLKL